MDSASHIAWFVHPETNPPCPLGFIGTRKGGALIIGGRTGSHMTGHGETSIKKMKEIQRLGYLDLPTAISRNIVSASWTPPTLNSQDSHLVELIEKGKL